MMRKMFWWEIVIHRSAWFVKNRLHNWWWLMFHFMRFARWVDRRALRWLFWKTDRLAMWAAGRRQRTARPKKHTNNVGL